MTRPFFIVLSTVVLGTPGCSGGAASESDAARGDTSTTDGDSSHDSTSTWPEADTGSCPESSASYDECCWDGREVLAGPELLDDVLDCTATWDASHAGITVIQTSDELDAWWAAVGVSGRTDVDFSTDIAVGWIGETSDGCDEKHFDGLRPGNDVGSWLAGVGGWSYCGAPDACTTWTVRATLWTGPAGDVTECDHGGFCDG